MKTTEENNDWINGRTAIISEMLDNPDKYGIYPTTRCFEKLDELHYKLMESYAKKQSIMIEELKQKYKNKIAQLQKKREREELAGRSHSCVAITGEIQAYNAVIRDLENNTLNNR